MNSFSSRIQPRTNLWKISLRVLFILLLATLIGRSLNLLAKTMDAKAQPAGFARGLLQGALMPMAMPNLLVGKDVAIYAENNTGVNYKLGYTAGVNGCGTVFFGIFFWRLRRLKKWAREMPIRSQ